MSEKKRLAYNNTVIYVGRSGVFTDRTFTEKIEKTVHTQQEEGWELVSVAPRSSPLGDVSGMWLFFRRPGDPRDVCWSPNDPLPA